LDVQIRFLMEITVILAVAGLTAVLFTRMKMPVVIGYLAAGILVGPYLFQLNLVTDMDTVNSLANLGIILLMFTIGLDFNIRKLRQTGVFAIVAGTIEIVLMITIGYALGWALGWSSIESIFLGAVMSISSTAVIVKVLTDAGHIQKQYASGIIGILIMEDIAAVIILAMVSPLGSGKAPGLSSAVGILGGAVLFIALSLVLGFAVVPRMVDHVKRHYPSEVLLLVSLGLCFGMALISSEIGLSVAIGAFVMGVIVSQSAAQNEIVLKTMPIKEMFMAVFFVSIGMLIDPRLVLQNILPAMIIATVFIVGKIFSVTTATYVANTDARSSMMSGMAMVAMGEFSFVIAKTGVENGTLSQFFYSSIIGAALITMIALPLTFRYSSRTVDYLASHLPYSIVVSLRRTEALRTEVRTWMSTHAERRREILHHLFWIFVDFTIILLIQVFAGFFFDFGNALQGVATWLSMLPTTLGMAISVALIVPPLISVMRRMRRIVAILVKGLVESGRYQMSTGRNFFRIMTRLGYIFTFVALFFLLIPIAPMARDFPFLLIVAVVVGILVTIWLRDINKATYDRMTNLLSENLLEPKDEAEE
jgi:monovalent cation:H+ antiporter-2, CPA2 family